MNPLTVSAGLAARFHRAHMVRRERGLHRGSADRGTHVPRQGCLSDGGGEIIEYHVPKDAQANACLFVPKDRTDKEHGT